MKKRLFPILLAIVMSLSLLPVSAMAEAGDWEDDLLTPASEIKSRYNIQNGVSGTARTTKTLGTVELKVMPTYTEGDTTYNAMAY